MGAMMFLSFKTMRKSRGLSQFELAQQLGVTRSCIAMWETGKSEPNIYALKKMARILNCTVDELIA